MESEVKPKNEWATFARPPEWALKTIRGGRLNGMTDIDPIWRYQIMNDVFGQCGTGWEFVIVKLWTEPGADGEIMAFAQVDVRVRGEKDDEMAHGWIPGIGGNKMISKEKSGMHNNDECFKMAVTDAISTALKMIGVGADIYRGRWDGSKYHDDPEPGSAAVGKADSSSLFGSTPSAYEAKPQKEAPPATGEVDATQAVELEAVFKELAASAKMNEDEINDFKNTCCNASHDAEFKNLLPAIIQKWDQTWSWWKKQYLTRQAKEIFGA